MGYRPSILGLAGADTRPGFGRDRWCWRLWRLRNRTGEGEGLTVIADAADSDRVFEELGADVVVSRGLTSPRAFVHTSPMVSTVLRMARC